MVVTYDDYAAMPDDGNRYEIHEGELVLLPSPGTRHQLVCGNLLILLMGYIRERKAGSIFHAPLDVILAPITVVQPDLVFVSKARDDILTERAVEGSPDLAIEIISPLTEPNEHGVKKEIYSRYKVPAYWIVDPIVETVEIYLHDGDQYQLATKLKDDSPKPVPPFSDLQLTATEIFK